MAVLKSLCSAFLMYSRLPFPRVEWREENRRYALCFFPLIGAVIGALMLAWHGICGLLNAGAFIFAAVGAAIPVVVTGGIHLDGFCDVCDAMGAVKEKRLGVMSDPRIGSFAAVRLALYLIVQTSLLSAAGDFKTLFICSLGFVMSRAWSAAAAVTFKPAKEEGALFDFSNPARRGAVIISSFTFLAAALTAAAAADPAIGAAAFLGGTAAFLYYRAFAYKNFGGVTGDLAGYFLQICELAVMAAAVAARLITEVLL